MTTKLSDLTPLEPWIARKIGVSRLTREALADYQLARLQETLAWVRERSRFYREHLAAAPSHLETLDDWAMWPFTTATDIQDDALRFVCVSQSDIARVVTLDTSGTTGAPKRLYFTAADQELTVDFFQAGMSTFTVPGDRVLILLPCARPGSVGDLLAQAVVRIGAEGIRHGPVQDVRATLNLLARERVTGLVGTPVQVLALARFPEQPQYLMLRFALLTTDHVSQALAAAVEAAWGCTVYNHYGMTEMGLGGGVDCVARRGYHLREADLYFEIVDPNTGQPLPDGDEGEIVFTTLTRQGMPLVRYRTGDLGRFVPAPCPCGTLLKTLTHITHRRDNVVQLPTGDTLALAGLDEVLFALEGVVDFTAVYEPGVLTLTLATYRSGTIVPEAQAALLASPVIARAVGGGALRLEVNVTPAGVPSPAKRTFLAANCAPRH
ncbi:MAG TPA: AMP-binding protein [Anaerolineae bacterium]|nr:AMP-binding protein [Anaerolineae bacterium]HQH37800.1 AMP-binding protein [Anaerolineae bacterium]